MARNTKELLQGIIVPDERITLANVDATNSSYTEQGPRPGVPVADDSKDTLRPIISGAQSVDVRAGIVRAGGVGDAELAFRTSTEGSSDWRGWGSPSAPVWTDAIFYVSGFDYAAHDCTTDPNTQDVLTVQLSYVAGNYKVYFTKWSASDWTSTTTLIGESTGTGVYLGSPRCCSIRIQESGRIVCFYGANSSYSDDSGANWASYAQGAFDTVTSDPTAHTRLRVFKIGGQLCALSLVTNDEVQQYASADEGKTWEQLQSGNQTLGTSFDVATLPDGSAWVVYRDTAGNFKALQMASAYQLVSGLTSGATTIDAYNSGLTDAGYVDVAIACDPDGRLYAYGTGAERTTAWRYVSGAWTVYTTGAIDAQDNASIYQNTAATCTMGAVALVTNGETNVSTGQVDVIRMTLLGGWSSLVADHVGDRQNSPGFRNTNAIHYQPLNVPDIDSGTAPWTSSGTAGGSASITSAGLVLSGANQMYKRTLPDDQLPFVVQWQVAATNTMMPSGVVPRPGLNISSVYTSGSTMYELRVLYRAAEVVVYCVACGGAVVTAAIADTAVSRIYHLQVDSDGTLEFLHRLPSETVWTLGGTGTPSTKTNSGSSFVQFGHSASGAGQASTWKWIQARKIADVGTRQLQWVRGVSNLVGRPLASLGSPAPVIGTTAQAAYLHAEGGSSPDASTYDIDAAHDYPVEAVLPAVEPSPSVGWRSTSTAEQSIVWDLGSATTAKTYMGKAIGLFVDGCNMQQIVVEYSDNPAGGWTTAGTLGLSSGYDSLNYTLTGDVVEVRAGSAEAADYIFGEDLVGSHIVLNGKSRKIAANLSGQWGVTGTTTRPALRLESVDGTESATQTGFINMQRGAMIIYGAALVKARYWRLRIPASQAVCGLGADPETGYRIGSVVFGEFMAFGSGTGSGWNEVTSPNYTEVTTRRGSVVRKSYGPPSRRWSLVWDEADRFLGDQDPDWVGNSNSDQPLAALAEVYEQLRAIARRVSALAVPVVAVRYTPTANGANVITDPSATLYGHVSGEVELQQVSGDKDHGLASDIQQQVIRAGAIQLDEVI
jgi:hypothetical protein